MTKIKLKDVAEKAGVSKSTVSQYLNKRYQYMSQETRDRIQSVVEDLGYQPNGIARSLKIKKTNTIGVVVANILHTFSTYVSRGIEDYCQQHGYNVILCNADNNPKKEESYLQMLRMKQVDGIIIAATGKCNELISNEIGKGFPIVQIDRYFDDLETDIVIADNYHGVFEAVEHLIRQRYKRIGLVVPEGNMLSVRRQRMEGYYEALKKYGIPVDESLVKFLSKENAQRQLSSLFEMEDRPTAVFTTNDLMAIETLTFLKENNIRIPEEIAIATFDELTMASLLESPLTVVAQPAYDIGMTAADLLIKRIEGKGKRKYQKKVLSCKLIVRESCGAAREAKNNTKSST